MTQTNLDFDSVFKIFSESKEFDPYGSAEYAIYALWLMYQQNDPQTLMQYIVDGSDDGKVDVAFFDYDNKLAIIIQSTLTIKDLQVGATASTNKCDDLNTAAGWLLTSNGNNAPKKIEQTIIEMQNGIRNGDITKLDFWYVHNYYESKQVRNHLSIVENDANGLVATYFPSNFVNISSREVGRETLIEWYQKSQAAIYVTDSFELVLPKGFRTRGEKWSAYTTAIPLRTLKEIYEVHGEALFSPNIRGYMGISGRNEDINKEIRNTATNEPYNFWLYNNGITCLVNSIDDPIDILGDELHVKLKVNGLAIVNGAQTTGAISGTSTDIDKNASVLVRFFECKDKDTTDRVIQYNNTQNALIAPDFKSNDPTQKRLIKELANLEVSYQIRRSIGTKLKKGSPSIRPDTMAKALAAVHREPYMAYHEMTLIWSEAGKYATIFSDKTTGKHSLFCVSLMNSIERRRSQVLKFKEEELTGVRIDLIDFFKRRGSTILATTAIATSLDEIISKRIPDMYKVAFKDNFDLKDSIERWVPVIESCEAFFTDLNQALEGGRIIANRIQDCLHEFTRHISSVAAVHKEEFEEFAKLIVIN